MKREEDAMMETTADCRGFDPATVVLSSGSHGPTYKGECCLVEAGNLAATCIPEIRERFGAPNEFSDDHPSICRVVRAFEVRLNDSLALWKSDEERSQALRPFILRQLGTVASREVTLRRAFMAADWAVRVVAPIALRAAGLEAEAAKLAELAPIADRASARAAERAAAREAAARWAARAAAGAAAAAARADAADAAAIDEIRTSAVALLDAMIEVRD